jgi:hypothetical protein
MSENERGTRVWSKYVLEKNILSVLTFSYCRYKPVIDRDTMHVVDLLSTDRPTAMRFRHMTARTECLKRIFIALTISSKLLSYLPMLHNI